MEVIIKHGIRTLVYKPGSAVEEAEHLSEN